jgi:alpha-ketoglutarate-dependent 2,4-dichlorophenoxyacetate dioxygenase
MALSITPARPGTDFVAKVTGIDLRHRLDDGTFRRVAEAFGRYAVLIFPAQDIDDAQQMAFSERFGPLETSINKNKNSHLDPRMSNISNADKDGNVLDPASERAFYNRGNQLWHSDSSFKPIPATASLLSGRDPAPEGGETEFADMRAAWNALPAHLQAKLDGLVGEHSLQYSRSTMGFTGFTQAERNGLPPVLQTVARIHPATGRKSLYLGSHCSHFIGWDIEESRRLIRELMEFATQAPFVYQHKWSQNDLVMWDNRCTLHRGRPFDEARWPRIMRRTTVRGDGPTVPLEQMQPGAVEQARIMMAVAAE